MGKTGGGGRGGRVGGAGEFTVIRASELSWVDRDRLGEEVRATWEGEREEVGQGAINYLAVADGFVLRDRAGGVVGIGAFRPSREGRTYIEYMASREGGRGIGMRLLTLIAEDATTREEGLRLNALRGAAPFYLSLGFTGSSGGGIMDLTPERTARLAGRV